MSFPTTFTNAQDTVTEIVAKHINNLETKVGIDDSADPNSLDYKVNNPVASDLAILVGNLLFPVGSIYTSISATNPGTSLGFGTWVSFGSGRVLVGLDSGQTEFDTVEETGGEKTHVLSVAELVSHAHRQKDQLSSGGGNIPSTGGTFIVDGFSASTTLTDLTGSGNAHNNLQPYIVVYMWKRTV